MPVENKTEAFKPREKGKLVFLKARPLTLIFSKMEGLTFELKELYLQMLSSHSGPGNTDREQRRPGCVDQPQGERARRPSPQWLSVSDEEVATFTKFWGENVTQAIPAHSS